MPNQQNFDIIFHLLRHYGAVQELELYLDVCRRDFNMAAKHKQRKPHGRRYTSHLYKTYEEKMNSVYGEVRRQQRRLEHCAKSRHNDTPH